MVFAVGCGARSAKEGHLVDAVALRGDEGRGTLRKARGRFERSVIPGSPIARISPGLFAACHVLHRLSVPRHPPDALTSRLITGVSTRKRRTTAAHRAKTPARGAALLRLSLGATALRRTQRPRMKTLLRTDLGQALCLR